PALRFGHQSGLRDDGHADGPAARATPAVARGATAGAARGAAPDGRAGRREGAGESVDMTAIPDDVFTEPGDVSPETLAELGPLCRLAGVWQSDQGVEVSPKAAGPERRVFRELIRMEPIDPQANGPQLLYGLRYHIHINTAEEAITFHDQVGYWLWEPTTGLIMQTIAIPRGQVVLAGGGASPDGRRIS